MSNPINERKFDFEQDHPLKFTDETQQAIVGHCIMDTKFFNKCRTKLKHTWFTADPMLATVFSQLCQSYEKDKAFITSPNEFKGENFFLQQTFENRERYSALIDTCISARALFSVEKLRKNLTAFIRMSLFKEGIEGAAKRYKERGTDAAAIWLNEKVSELNVATFEDDSMTLSFEDAHTWLNQEQKYLDEKISTGCKNLDEALGGGLFKSDSCAIMAPSNSGKTSALITIARHAAFKQQSVLFLLHEGNATKLRTRILGSWLGLTQNTLLQMSQDPVKKHLIEKFANHLDHYLDFIPYIKATGMFIEDIVELIKAKNEERILRLGKGYDIIIDDYPKKLKSRHFSMKRESMHRVELADIYDTFNHLAAELNVHCLVALQTNRTGLKQNNRKIESDSLLGMEEADESFGIVQNLGNIITLNRSPEDKHNNLLRFNIAKSRNNSTDISVTTRTDFSVCLTHGDKDMFLDNRILKNDLNTGFLASLMHKDNALKSTLELDNLLKASENSNAITPQNIGFHSLEVDNIRSK